ncbi:MAG: hypothetical protein AAB408_01830 [Patescibacteria group bacterium]
MNQLPILPRRIYKFVTGATLLAFLALVLLGLFDCANSIMRSRMAGGESHQTMVDCVPGKDCGMDITTHISIWQGMTTTNLTANFSGLLMVLLMIGFIFVAAVLSLQASSLISRFLYYDRHHPEHRLYNYFIDIFSSGILQPKLFA